MKLYKSQVNLENYKKYSEEIFFEILEEMLNSKIHIIRYYENRYMEGVYTMDKILKKNSVKGIQLRYTINDTIDGLIGVSILDASIEDVLSLIDIILNLEYLDAKEYSKAEGYDFKIYEELNSDGSLEDTPEEVYPLRYTINYHFIEDLDGMYEIKTVDDKIIIVQSLQSQNIDNSKVSKDIKVDMYNYYKPNLSLREKRDILTNIAKKVESKKIPKKLSADSLYSQSISEAKKRFNNIVNKLKIRHENDNSEEYEIEKEIELMNLAMSLAVVLLEYEKEWYEPNR